jgi:hypothetical protein
VNKYLDEIFSTIGGIMKNVILFYLIIGSMVANAAVSCRLTATGSGTVQQHVVIANTLEGAFQSLTIAAEVYSTQGYTVSISCKQI